MASGLENIETIESPFRRFVTTIGVFPTAFTDAMTYYECLAYLVKYLEETVIPAVNDNAEALEELQSLFIQLESYVDNYFDNLDVQEEINNKLDAMVADGSFQAILDNYVQPKLDELDQKIADNKDELETEITNVNNALEDDIATEATMRNNADTNLQNQISGLASGAPIPVASTSDMTDTSKIYVNTTDGYWYYYDGDSWEQGGIYQASQVETDTTLTQAGVPADAKATGEALDEIKEVTTVTATSNTAKNVSAGRQAGYYTKDGTFHSSTTYDYVTVPCQEGDIFIVPGGSYRFACCYVGDTVDPSLGDDNGESSFTVPATVTKITISFGHNYPELRQYSFNQTILRNVNNPNKVVLTDSIGKVESDNIFGMTKTNNTITSNNLFYMAELMEDGKYVQIDQYSHFVNYMSNASYKTYRIRVKPGTYTFTSARFAVQVKDDGYTVVGNLSNTDSITVSDTSVYYIYFSFNASGYPESTFSITTTLNVYQLPNNWAINPEDIKSDTASEIDTLANGDSIKIESLCAIKDGYNVTFKANITDFYKLRLAFYNPSDSLTNYIDIDATNLTIKNKTTDPVVQAHGLTIADDISIEFMLKDSNATIRVTSKGVSYSNEYGWIQTGGTVAYPIVISDGTVATHARLNLNIPAVKRDIWFFGDSYISFNAPERWPYYLVEDDLSKNILISGSTGCGSVSSNYALSALMTYDLPKFAVFATGMNDGGDGESSPNATWATQRDSFLAYCQANNITPIFGTIPTVPTINNEQKNAWIRNSGYRYIDFAKAVGANSSGVWYTGMLSGDGVHPSTLGAKALYNQVLADLPEILG